MIWQPVFIEFEINTTVIHYCMKLVLSKSSHFSMILLCYTSTCIEKVGSKHRTNG